MVVDIGIAKVYADAVSAMLLAGLVQPVGHQVKRLVPVHLLPASRGSPDRLPQAVRILVEILECNCLRANMPPAERVIFITLDGGNVTVFHFDCDTAHGLA